MQEMSSARLMGAGRSLTAFMDGRRVAAGTASVVIREVQRLVREAPSSLVLVFDDRTGETVEWDARGLEPIDEAPATGGDEAGAVSAPRGPGRPRLGVVAREVTLLPRHWEWLSSQPGGASVALRKLVEQARRADPEAERRREAREATYRFLSVAGGNEPGFEEAIRALFAGRAGDFAAKLVAWPGDLREHGLRMAAASFAPPASE